MPSDVDGIIAGVNKIQDVGNLLTQRIAYTSQGYEEYIGEALAGSATSSAVWRIKKLTYDSNGQITSLIWADSDTNFDNVWDNYDSLDYG